MGCTGIKFNNTQAVGQGIYIWPVTAIEERDLLSPIFFSDARRKIWLTGGGRGNLHGLFCLIGRWRTEVFAIRHGMECIDATARDIA